MGRPSSPMSMKPKPVMAILSFPQNHLCTVGKIFWSNFKHSQAKGELPSPNRPIIPPESLTSSKKCLKELSKESIIEGCVQGAAQYQNESFHSLTWN